jgi:hypothetical protein
MATAPTSVSNGIPAETESVLSDLWRRRLDTLISGIANGDPYYQQIANAAEHVSAEYQGRFLIELIQNANDQAVRQGLSDSVVTITRTEKLIAVGNSGQPFDRTKVDAVTSIFKSDKSADECIGNKGVGFKAVFQIADSAEIFSSATGGNLAEGCAIALRIVRQPFEDADFLDRIRALADELLSRYDDRRRAIEERFCDETAVDVTLREARRAAWFTFPLPITEDQFRGRISELQLSSELLLATQTLVVLPTVTSSHTSSRVSKAIDEVLGGNGDTTQLPPAASFLFLPGIAAIQVNEHVRGFKAELDKRDTSAKEVLDNAIVLRRQQTRRRQIDLLTPDASPTASSQDWWVAERTLGGDDSGDDDHALSERNAIREAIRTLHLPDENWKDVEQIPIAVALPDPSRGDNDAPKPIGARGRFCIGLPTQVQTGSPLWVSAHFHGKIDRTAIDFQNDYNSLLFDSAVELSGVLLGRLKREPNLATRRLVTLAMERGNGELATAFYEPDGPARADIVLRTDGAFMKAIDLRLPKAADLPMFDKVVEGVGDLGPYGLCLPDRALLSSARMVLDGLADRIEVSDSRYLFRPPGLPSLLEHAARLWRDGGPSFWEVFLTWVLDRFSVQHADAMVTQMVLPTGSTDLSSASMRVFFRPVGMVSRGGEEKEKPQAVDDAGDELATIDETVAPLLKFFDDSTIKVRAGTARDYTVLAQRLAPNAGGGLVRRPRQADLINDALIPALKASTDDNERALSLLRQALIWLVGMPNKSKNRVSTDELLVPVRGQGDAWEWVEPDSAYLGEGWDDHPNINLLTRAFGNRARSQLIPWDRFERKARQLFKASDKRWWLDRVKELGVWDCPRIIRSGRRLGIGQSDSYSYLTPWTWVQCPTPACGEVWPQYVNRICRRSANTKSGQEFYLSEVCWIDGLENNDIRATVVEAMLRRPERYGAASTAKLSRWGGEDSTDVRSLWVHAFLSEGWSVIPTSAGLRSPGAAWFLPLEARTSKADRFAFLPCVKAEFSAARSLLSTIGVITVEEAPIVRLVAALHELASRVTDSEPEHMRHIGALAADLYEAIQARLKSGESPDAVRTLVGRPIPLVRNEAIGSADLKDLERVYIEDDTIRRRFVRGFTDSWVIPKRFHQSYNELVESLRDVIGAEKVVRVSECDIDVHFQALEEGIPILDYVRKEYPSRSVAEEIGLLIVKGGTQITSPHEETFRQVWGQFTRTRIVRGEFKESALRACFDAQHDGGPVLLVSSKLRPNEVIAEMWQLVGPAYRDIWWAYSQSLNDGPTNRFFEERGVSPTERTEVEVAIGLGFEQRLRRYQPVCLAAWRRTHATEPADEFHKEWAKAARTVELATAWLGWSDLSLQIELAMREDEPRGSLLLLDSLKLSVQDWQRARGELGESPWRFAESERLFESARTAIAGHIMAWYAYLVVPRATGSSGPTVSAEIADIVHKWADRVRLLTVPDQVVQEHLEAAAVVSAAALSALQIGAGLAEVQGETVLVEPLQNLGRTAPTDVVSIKLKDEPDKAATIYERDDTVIRSQQAVATTDAVLKVAVALAAKHGEAFDDTVLRKDELVVLLSQASWANRVSVLAAVRHALEKAAPKTASRMKDRQAFRDFDDWRALWQKFDELGEIPKPPTPAAPKPKFDVLGTGWTQEDFDASAAEGPAGELARRLEQAVNLTLDLAALRSVARNKIDVKVKRTGPPRGKAPRTGNRVPDKYLEMLGAVGEYFVYQQLKALCPDFDATSWRSRARELFGFEVGDDSLGHDFEYTDVGGVLTGRVGSLRCLLEVKSSAHECGDSFEMSTNEWDVARRCHEKPDNGIYIIVRVANVASIPMIVDLLVDPVELHLQGTLDYSSRNLLVVLGRAK